MNINDPLVREMRKHSLIMVLALLLCGLVVACEDSAPDSSKIKNTSPGLEKNVHRSEGNGSIPVGKPSLTSSAANRGGSEKTEPRLNSSAGQERARAALKGNTPPPLSESQVIFPGSDGGTGLSLADIKARLEAVQRMDMRHVVIPQPGNNRDSGLTLAELKARAQEARQQMDLSNVVIPQPGSSGKSGLTMAELKARADVAKQQMDTHDLVVMSPGNDSVPALTVAELKALVEAAKDGSASGEGTVLPSMDKMR